VGVTRQGLYAWRARGPSARSLCDQAPAAQIAEIHDQTLGIYGAPRIHAELSLGHGVSVGKKRVARIMRALGIFGASGRRAGPRTTTRDPARASAPDLVDRDFARSEPNRLWVFRHQIRPDRPGVPVSGRRPGCLLASDRWLVDAR